MEYSIFLLSSQIFTYIYMKSSFHWNTLLFSTFSQYTSKGGSDDVSQGIQLELLETLRGLMNNEMGMENALSVEGLFASVIRCLDFNNLENSR